jgi:ParB/RepB/Spo0J family partition protein
MIHNYSRCSINKEDLDELKDSIQNMGLLQPIVVMEKKNARSGERKYSLVVGSRRVLAHEELKREKILAVIIGEQDQERVLAASLAENMFRSKLSHKDTAKAVTELYKLYGKNIRRVAKETGMWPTTVLRYVYLEEYGSDNMRDWVQDGKVALGDVKRVLEAAKWNIAKAERMLEAMIREGMTRTQKKDFTEYMTENQSATIKQGVEDTKKPRVQNKILVDLPPDIQKGVEKAMNQLQMADDEVALLALKTWLHDQGYA